MIRADVLLADALTKHTVDGYTSWPAYAATLVVVVRDLANQINTLSGDNATASKGCQITRVVVGDAYVPVEYELDPGDPGCYRTRNGDGWPEIPPSVTIIRVFLNGRWCDAEDVFDADTLDRWSTEILEQIGDEQAAAEEAHWDERRERFEEAA